MSHFSFLAPNYMHYLFHLSHIFTVSVHRIKLNNNFYLSDNSNLFIVHKCCMIQMMIFIVQFNRLSMGKQLQLPSLDPYGKANPVTIFITESFSPALFNMII